MKDTSEKSDHEVYKPKQSLPTILPLVIDQKAMETVREMALRVFHSLKYTPQPPELTVLAFCDYLKSKGVDIIDTSVLKSAYLENSEQYTVDEG